MSVGALPTCGALKEKNMIRDLSNPIERDQFRDHINKLLSHGVEHEQESKPYMVEVKVKRSMRSLSQNSYLHVLISFFALEYGCSTEEAKIDYYKRLCNRDLFVRHKRNKQGKEISTVRSSSELTTDEMSLSITRFRNWSSAEGGIYLPSADEHNYLTYCQQQIENNKDYL